ncbi:hypothetical protein PIB30_084014, partial [Stylosanthes scabra]|nr:hypothetical protein [Stylosanthes scabra]
RFWLNNALKQCSSTMLAVDEDETIDVFENGQICYHTKLKMLLVLKQRKEGLRRREREESNAEKEGVCRSVMRKTEKYVMGRVKYSRGGVGLCVVQKLFWFSGVVRWGVVCKGV